MSDTRARSRWVSAPRREAAWNDAPIAHHDPDRGKTAAQLAAERRAVRLAPEAWVPPHRLVGRALVALADGPLDAHDFRDRLGDVEDDRVAELSRHVVVVPSNEAASGWQAWAIEAVERRATCGS